MDTNQTIQFTKAINELGKLWPKLPNIAATVAVNFSKERFVQQNWVDRTTSPWKRNSDAVKRSKNRGRAILVKTGRLKRDVQKIYVTANTALIGTSKLTVPYAKAHNEGFKGTVQVKAFKRHRYKKVKEKYTTKKGNERSRTSKQLDDSKPLIVVRTHNRKMNIKQNKFLGPSAVLDTRIERQLTAEIIRVLKTV